MQIPLDYYRILGLPIQATDEQLHHAHRDRKLQLPRREYSEAAISARRSLIEEAYDVLSDPAQRQAYDGRFLANPYEAQVANQATPSLQGEEPRDVWASSDPVGQSMSGQSTPGSPNASVATLDRQSAAPISSIEINDDQFVGALLILLELGEYELVLRLGRPFLTTGAKSLGSGQYGDPDIVGADIVLTVALACLELGREQWQQGLYENAAESLETGQELLLREGLFAGIRSDIQADLFKLRPYRILELLASSNDDQSARYQGIQLLQDMLNERGGIDGAGNDQSGLSTDDFLRFIQQLRTYLTAEEQLHIFEAEAQRPSAVATYLAVYALIARGFAYRLPALLRQAKLFLQRLWNRQDVALERAICVLLLGQTEEATVALEQSNEYSALAFIREHSKGSPDLLPGLCLYAERWLQNEVFPHFRDLSQAQASLKDFFADEHVQSYLEALANEPDTESPWAAAGYSAWSTPATNGNVHAYSNGARYSYPHADGTTLPLASGQLGGTATATLDAPSDLTGRYGTGTTGTPPTAERVSTDGGHTRLSGTTVGSRRLPVRQRGWLGLFGRSPRRRPSSSSAAASNTYGTTTTMGHTTRRRPKQSGPRLDRIVFLAATGLVGILILWMVLSRVLGWLGESFAGPQLEGEQLALNLAEPVMVIPDPAEVAATEEAAEATGELTPEIAEQVIERWLSAKSEAMGENYNVSALDDILVDSMLARLQGQSRAAENGNWYWEYEHPTLEINNVVWSEEQPDQGTIEANVQEVGQYYVDGQLSMAETYDSNLNVRYGVVRRDGLWKISSVQVID